MPRLPKHDPELGLTDDEKEVRRILKNPLFRKRPAQIAKQIDEIRNLEEMKDMLKVLAKAVATLSKRM